MSRFSEQLARGLQKVEEKVGEPVTYRRGTYSVQLIGTRGDKSATDQDTGSETQVEGIRVDWIFTAGEINQDAGEIIPLDGDEIVDASGTVYRVTKNPFDGKVARWMRHRVAKRVHTLVTSGE